MGDYLSAPDGLFEGNLAWQLQDGAYKTIYFDGRDYNARGAAINDFDITAGASGTSDLNHVNQPLVVGPYFPRHYLLPLNEPCGNQGLASAINDTATIVGTVYNSCHGDEAVRFSLFGYATPLLKSPPPTGYDSDAIGINQAGDIIGYAYQDDYAYASSFLYRAASNGVTFLPRPAGEPSGSLTPTGLNEKDQVVGVLYIAGDRFNPSFSSGWLYSGGATFDLNTLLPKNSLGWVVQEAFAINNAGQIVGTGTYHDPVTGETDTGAFVMTP